MTKQYSYDEAMDLFLNGAVFPQDFNQWALADEHHGLTIAHEAAIRNRLPAGFNQWELADKWGWTVAHVRAACGGLPTDFAQWDLADERGWTVATVAINNHRLSEEAYASWRIKRALSSEQASDNHTAPIL
jgi:hypothetical protein